MLVIRLPPEIEERHDALARKLGRTKSYCAREVILEYQDDLEDIHPSERRYAAFLAGKVRTSPLEDVEHKLGLAD